MAAVAEGRGLAADALLGGDGLEELHLDGLVGECGRVVRRQVFPAKGVDGLFLFLRVLYD